MSADLGSEPAPSPVRRGGRRALLLLVVGVAIQAAVTFVLAMAFGGTPSAQPLNGVMLSPARELPALSLARADGGRFATEQTRGRLSLFFFGYTSCPDVCPMTLANVAQLRRSLGNRASDVDTFFVTVDPARDTPDRLRAYLASFGTGVVGLTGTDAELERARAAFGVVAERRPTSDGSGSYSVDHTAAISLVDAEGRLSLVYSYGTTPEEIRADLLHLLDRR